MVDISLIFGGELSVASRKAEGVALFQSGQYFKSYQATSVDCGFNAVHRSSCI